MGIQFGLSAFNQTISCCTIHKSSLITLRTLCAAYTSIFFNFFLRDLKCAFSVKIYHQGHCAVSALYILRSAPAVCGQITLFCRHV